MKKTFGIMVAWFILVNVVITVIAGLPDCIQMAIMIICLWSFLPLYMAVMNQSEEES